MKFSISEFFSLVITILITLAGLLQGLDSVLNLWERWHNRSPNEASSGAAFSSRNGKKHKSKFRWTQRKINTIFWCLFASLEIWPLYVYFSAFGTWDALFVWVSYVIILFSFPMWSYRSKQATSKRFLKFAISCICLEMILANAFVLGLFPTLNEEWPPVVAMLHLIAFLGQRYSLIIFLGAEYIRPWFQRLPEK